MKLRKSILLIFLCLGVFNAQSQTRSTKATKIIVAINKQSNIITGLELYNMVEKDEGKALIKRHPKAKFFSGVLKGKYEIKNALIKVKTDATIIVHTAKPYLTTDTFDGKNLGVGENITLANSKIKVTSQKKGELTLIAVDNK